MAHHDDDDFSALPSADLETVTGGAGSSSGMDSMMPMMMMMMMGRKGSAAPPPPPPAPVTPKIMLNGVEQKPTMGANGLSYNSEV